MADLKIDKLRDVKVLAGIIPRDYSYDRFWIVFRLADDRAQSIFPGTARECELVVRIHDKEGKVTWTIPESIRQRAAAPAAKR